MTLFTALSAGKAREGARLFGGWRGLRGLRCPPFFVSARRPPFCGILKAYKMLFVSKVNGRNEKGRAWVCLVAYRDGMGEHKWFAETADVAVEYARSSNGKQREAAARSPLTPAADLSRLSQDSVAYVRNAACENPKTPVCDLAGYVSAILFGASGGCLSEKAASNPALPAHFVGDCIVRAVGECERRKRAVSLSVKRLIVNPNLPERVMLWLVEGKRPGYETVLDNPSATGRVLRVLADDPDWGIRCSVAGHVNAPRDVLVNRAHDDEERVREVALINANMPERVFDEVIVRDASKAATIHKLVHYSQSVYAQVLAYTRFGLPYANDDECLALRGVSWDAGEWLRKHDMKGVR